MSELADPSCDEHGQATAEEHPQRGLLAQVPGIRSLGSVTDPLGRRGEAVALPDGAPGGSVTERHLVVDTATGHLLATETVLVRPGPVGPVSDSRAPVTAPAGTILTGR
ncbi:hypothetical protein [Microtetraspora sp. NBRC 16547]|uniref:hypothetical protein n=1 Tax=Microtetraspora sp. NBRC 16547 TaxID=3030993 RepID=UPI0024A37CAF|nr:hypothetical protein [Microtetraspora sp. NBRC 16547]GLX02057.1 hypothetical protein Misp02_61430 [Microtetraspora sp. NBRC 16547]